MGRGTTYSEETGNKICEIIASSNKSLTTISKELNIPYGTIREWIRSNETFSINYARAKEDQADFLAEEILTIADDHTRDIQIIEIAPGVKTESVDHEVIQRSKLRVDSRKWLASKLRPKKYGDKMDVTSDGEALSGGVTDEQFNLLLQAARGS